MNLNLLNHKCQIGILQNGHKQSKTRVYVM